MASKNCPHCSKQVPVACKKCGCGHVFFAARRNATSISRDTAAESPPTGMDILEQQENPPDSMGIQGSSGISTQPTRRSGRVTRERPNFYDALQYENQTKRQKQLTRKQSKAKSEDQDEGVETGTQDSGIGGTQDSGFGEKTKNPPPTGSLVVKKKRGRPPGITSGRKPNQGYKIHNNAPPKVIPMLTNVEDNSEESLGNMMAGISAEKALQYNVVLQDINQKIVRVSWKAL